MVRLSEAGELKLRKSLIDTITAQKAIAVQAFRNQNEQQIKEVGHLLKGNSGAHYFNLHHILELGESLEQLDISTDSEEVVQKFEEIMTNLDHWIIQLRLIADTKT